MNKLFVILIITLTAVFANADCNKEAINSVSKIAGINDKELSILGHIQADLVFITFVADTYNEGLVYELKLDADNQCHLEGYYESSLYSDEFDASKMAEYSIFL